MKVTVQEPWLDLHGYLQDPENHQVEMIGNPKLMSDGIVFSGTDGLLIHQELFPGIERFTVSIRFNPSSLGPWQQRFFHIQDLHSQDRFLMELRMEPDGTWYADTFFQSGDHHCILQDPDIRFPADQWYDYVVSYDGSTLRHTINGKGLIEATFPDARLPRASGCALGIRWNKVYPFVGIIQSVKVAY